MGTGRGWPTVRRAAALLALVLCLLWPNVVQADDWWTHHAPATAAAVPAADAVSQASVYGYVRTLAVDVGSRPADSDAFRRAAGFARDLLVGLGYRVAVQEFTYPRFEDLGSSLRLDDEGRVIAGAALFDSPAGEVTAPLVDVGLARPNDLAGLALEGTIALARRGDIAFGEKAQNVARAGAAGLVVYNSEDRPLSGRLDRPATIPVLGLSQSDGAALVSLLRGGPRAAKLTVRVLRDDRPSANVVAEGGPPGAAGRVVVGAHLDSVPAGPGANDNGSGAAAVLELARVFAGRPESQRLTFALFGAEELGLIGSHQYVASLGGDAHALRAMVNLDMVAVGDRFQIGGAGERSRDLGRRGIEAATALGYRAVPFDPGGASDHASFSAGGVPAVMLHWTDDPNYHQAGDTWDKLDPEKLTASTRTAAKLLESLLDE